MAWAGLGCSISSVAIVAMLCTANSTLSAQAVKQPVSSDFTLIAVGDLIYTQPIMNEFAKNAPQVLKILQSGTITHGNLEESLLDQRHFAGYPQPVTGGSWLLAPPEVAKDLRQMGFNLLSRANNHATDWGVEGFQETDRLLDAEGLTHAGTGESRSAAATPGFRIVEGRKVALVSLTTTFSVLEPAQDGTRDIGSRPGANVLRVTQAINVQPNVFNQLETIANSLPKDDQVNTGKSNQLSLQGQIYQKAGNSKQTGSYSYEVNRSDRNLVLESIHAATAQGALSVVSVHSHQSTGVPNIKSAQDVEVPEFLRQLAHDSIDHGAAVVVVHGPHILRPIEIYKGRPIFYSLGNFFFMEDQVAPVPRDLYEKLNLSPDKPAREAMALWQAENFNAPEFFESIIARVLYRTGRPVLVELVPVDLGYDRKDGFRGVPKVASLDTGRRIISRVQRLSEKFGTKITVRDGRGYIDLPL